MRCKARSLDLPQEQTLLYCASICPQKKVHAKKKEKKVMKEKTTVQVHNLVKYFFFFLNDSQ